MSVYGGAAMKCPECKTDLSNQVIGYNLLKCYGCGLRASVKNGEVVVHGQPYNIPNKEK
jgi:hypothetical protein